MNTTSDPLVDVLFEGTETSRLKAIERSAHGLLEKMKKPITDGCIWSLTESVWPALLMPEFADQPVRRAALRLFPLSRIGQTEGQSGSLVLIGRFSDTEEGTRPESHRVVIKTRSVQMGDKLREEYESAQSIKPFVYNHKDNFSIPIDFDDQQEGYHVLWSIFSEGGPIGSLHPSESDRGLPGITDLRKPLNRGKHREARRILERTFDYLATVHNRLNRSYWEDRGFEEEYRRYLRKLDEGEWGAEWQSVWGTGDRPLVKDACGQFANPFYVLRRIRPLKKHMRIGAIHGDLHPGNIVLTDDQPHIIDFGWAQDGAHIAKDFVLMECNLRFHTLRSQLGQRDVHALSDWLEWERPVPTGLSDYTRGRANLICALRDTAKRTICQNGKEIDWNWEYIVPLFLVALGLLRFTPQLGNQQAAVRFVLALATHIEGVLGR